jgi:hypothetical protein
MLVVGRPVTLIDLRNARLDNCKLIMLLNVKELF